MEDKFHNGPGIGRVTTEYTAWCGRCNYWESQSMSKKMAMQHFKAVGWDVKKMVCSNCVRALKG